MSTQYQVIIPAELPADAKKRLQDKIHAAVAEELANHDAIVAGKKLSDILKPGKVGPIMGMFPTFEKF
jgi:hypothetical protein